jgi:hypothetical protein
MSSAEKAESRDDGRRGLIKAPTEFAAGLFLIALAAVGFFGSYALKFGTLSGIGPGLMPRVVSILVAVFGLLLVVNSMIWKGPRLDNWPIRGPLCILGSIVVFALTIRPLGLLVAGPLAIIISSLADNDTRWKEIIVYAAVLTAICYAMFKLMLRLPIPVFPPVLGY